MKSNMARPTIPTSKPVLLRIDSKTLIFNFFNKGCKDKIIKLFMKFLIHIIKIIVDLMLDSEKELIIIIFAA
jgi:hypothetical protein